MWQNKIKEIIYLLENSSVNEIDVRFWGRRFRVVKSPPVIAGHASAAPVANVAPSASVVSTSEEPKVDVQSTSSTEDILSPMPGTFYSSPSPDADSFVNEGDQIVKGDTLCIIEAMKIMNEIEAETNGVVKKVLIKNGTSVEYNQPLFKIEPV